jgi:hypothetical protein
MEHRELWEKSQNGKDCPGIAIGHFENKLSVSYVLSLVPKNGENLGFRLIAFNPIQNGNYVDKIVEKSNEPSNPQIVYKVPPGSYSDAEETTSVLLLNDGFQMEEMEKGALLYYWKGGRFHHLIVSE